MEEILLNSGIPRQKEFLTQKDFEAILSEVSKNMGLHLKGRRTMIKGKSNARNEDERASLSSFTIPQAEERSWIRRLYFRATSWLEDNRQHVAWLMVFLMINLAVAFERFWRKLFMLNRHEINFLKF